MSIKKHHRPDCTGGSCACPWRLDFRPLGVNGPHQRFQFPTRKAAEAYRDENQVKARRGEYRAPANIPTFAKVAEQWLREKNGLHPATLLEARTVMKHLAPLNDRRLDQISVATIEHLRDDLVAAGKLAPRTIARVMRAAAAIFKEAIRLNYTTGNPAAHAKRPRNPVTEVDDANEEQGALRPDEVLSSDEIARLLDASEPGLFRTLFATAAASGMRSEELLALAWSDIELETGRLFVRRSLSWCRDHEQVGLVLPRFYPTKTKAGNREIPLAPELVSMLRTWKLRCPPSKSDLVFCNEAGEPLRRSRVLTGGLYPACRRAGLRRCNVKTFRHSYASGLLSQGAPITMVQARMGHANPSITLKVYSHFIKGSDSGESDRYAASFLGKSAKGSAKVA